ncbi:BCL2 like 16 [Erpetoichthys calabaricus]|uniref:BCL2 like 16 n=1 Tax=Erpetoichthys calabaricus TaxID=27687 RepID=UPI0010A00952|nr:BCL2 like 16 [Erpetoichthys calabaricus]
MESGKHTRSQVDPTVREAYLMAHDYIDYVTKAPGVSGRPPSKACAALRHAGDTLIHRFPLFFKRWPRLFQEVTEDNAATTLIQILEEHFGPQVAGGRTRELPWSAILSIYMLAGQMAQHCQERGLQGALPVLKERVGEYVERTVCPQLRQKGGWSGFEARYGEKEDPERMAIRVCCGTLVLLAAAILTYFFWKRRPPWTS